MRCRDTRIAYESRTRKLSLASAAIMMAATFSAGTARADVIFDFLPTNTFSGTAPAGTLTADFQNVAGGVQLTITSSLASGENLDPGKALYLNINPADDASLGSLSFSLTANTGFSQAAIVMTGA